RKVFIQAVAELNVSAILYTYNSANELRNCRNGRGEAFLVLSPDAYYAYELAYFGKDKAIDPMGIGGYVKRLYKEGLDDYAVAYEAAGLKETMPESLSRFHVEMA